MRLPWTRWQSTLNKLGLKIVWGKRSQTPRKVPTRHSQLEKLESREVMTAQLSDFQLVSDTGTSATDLVTSDSRAKVTVTGTWTGRADVEFDIGGDGVADATRSVSTSGTTVTYDPRWNDSSLRSLGSTSGSGYYMPGYGPPPPSASVNLKARVKEFDSSGQLVSTSTWAPLGYTLEQPSQPEFNITNYSNYSSLTSGMTLDFGTVATGVSISKTLMLQNNGSGTLTLDPRSLTLPAGFTLTSQLPETISPNGNAMISIAFQSSTAGSYGSQIHFINNDADESDFTLTLSATVNGPTPEIDVRDMGMSLYSGSSQVNLGSTTVGTPVTKTFTIYNTGAANLNINASQTTVPSGFAIDGTIPSSIVPYSSATITLKALATVAGTFTGQFSIANNDSDEGPFIIPVSVTVNSNSSSSGGTIEVRGDGGYVLTSNMSTLSFGSVPAGQSLSKTITISNTGSSSLTISTSQISVPQGFSITSWPSGTVSPYQSTSMTIQASSSTAGTLSGQVLIPSSDPMKATFYLNVNATVTSATPDIDLLDGASYSLTSNMSSVGFGSVATGVTALKTFTIKNVGPGTLSLGSISLPTGFSLYSSPTSTTLAQNATTSFTVALQTSASGSYSGALTITSNDPDESPFSIQLSGTVASPPPEIDVQWNSQQLVSQQGSVAFGSTLVGQPVRQTLSILNQGSGILTISPSQISLPSGFTIVTQPSSTVAPGGSTSVLLEFTAASAGSFSGYLVIPNNDSDEGNYTLSISGTAVAPAPQGEIDIRQGTTSLTSISSTLSYGSTNQGTPLVQQLTIWNLGQGNLEINKSGIQVPAGFQVDSTLLPSTLAPGAYATISVRMTAATTGDFLGYLQIPSNDSDESPFMIWVNGHVDSYHSTMQVQLDNSSILNGQTIDFGSVATTGAVTRSLVLRNLGNAPLTVNTTGIQLPSGYVLGIPPATSTILPGASLTLDVRLQSSNSGSYSGNLVIESNDPARPQAIFALTGQVLAGQSEIEVRLGSQSLFTDVSSIDFGTVTVGTSVDKTITILNTGTTNLLLATNAMGLSLPAGISITTWPASSIAPGTSQSLTLRYQPLASGTLNGPLAITSNDADEGTFTLSLAGQATQPLSNLQVSTIQLVNDTGLSSTDQLTTDPTVQLRVTGTFNGQVKVEFDHNNDGVVEGNVVALTPNELLTYDPRTTDSAVIGHEGMFNLRYRIVQTQLGGDVTYTSDWSTFGFTMQAVSRAEIEVRDAAGTPLPSGAGSVDYGIVAVGAPAEKTLTIVNLGQDNLVLNVAAIEVPQGFTLVTPPAAVVAANGGQTTLTLRLEAAATAQLNTQLRIPSTDADEGVYTIRVSAVVRDQGAKLEVRRADGVLVAPSSGSVSFGTTAQGVAKLVRFSISNQGLSPLTINGSSIQVPVGFGVVSYPTAAISPGGSGDLWLRLDADTAGGYSGPVHIPSNSSGQASYDFTISGEVTAQVAQGGQAGGSNLTLVNVQLVKDTGLSSTDRLTCDTRLQGAVTGDISGGSLSVEVDVNNDGTVDGRVTPTFNGSSRSFVVDPATLPNWNSSIGSKTVKLRTAFTPWAIGGNAVFGNWEVFSLDVDAGMSLGGVSLREVGLLQDTGTSKSDHVTSDPRLYGLVRGELGTNTYQLQFDIDGNGTVDDSIPVTSAGQELPYDPRVTHASLASFQGNLLVGYRLVQLDSSSAVTAATGWDAVSLTLVSRPASELTIGNLHLIQDTGVSTSDRVTSTVNLAGEVLGTLPVGQQSVNGALAAQPFVKVDFDSDGDGIVDGEAEVNGRQFEFLPVLAGPGAYTIHARVREFSPNYGEYLVGAWSEITITVQADPAPPVQLLRLKNDTGATDDAITRDPTVTGKLPGAESAYQRVELEWTGDNQVDGIAYTQSDGTFEFLPRGLTSGTVTLRARSQVWDARAKQVATGAWSQLTFVYELAPLPMLGGLLLVNDTGVSSTDLITTDSRVHSILTGTGDLSGYEVEFDVNNDGLVDGNAGVASGGAFSYQPLGLQAGVNTVRARVSHWDALAGDYQVGAWVGLTFTLLAEPVTSSMTVRNIQFQKPSLDATGVATSNLASSDPAIIGTVGLANATPIAAGLTSVEIDSNSDGVKDAEVSVDKDGNFQFVPLGLSVGSHTLRFRPKTWDYSTRSLVVSPWQEYSFNLLAPKTNAPAVLATLDIEGFAGTSASTPRITSNPILVGSVTNDGKASGVVIEVDLNGDGVGDDITWTGSDGLFRLPLVGLAYGSHSVKARTVEWNEKAGAYNLGTWNSISFSYADLPNSPAVISDWQVTGGVDPSGAAAAVISGQVQNTEFLAGVQVQVDTNADGVPDRVAIADGQGKYSLSIVGGTGVVQVRTMEIDGPSGLPLYSSWTPRSLGTVAAADIAATISRLEIDPTATSVNPDGSVTVAAIRGMVTNDDGPAGVLVDLDYNNDGTPEKTLAVSNLGAFQFTANLSAGAKTIRARAKENVAGTSATQVGAWTSVSFTLLATPSSDSRLTFLGLVQDTGNSNQDKATSNPAIQGHVEGSGGVPVTLQIDKDGNGTVDATVTTDTNGDFAYVPQGLSTGVTTIRARVAGLHPFAEDDSRSWMQTTFVYSSQPDGVAAQALTTSADNIQATWKSASTNYESSLVVIQRAFTNAQATAQKSFDEALAAAKAKQESSSQAARAAFAAAKVAAENALSTQLATASNTLGMDLAAFAGDKAQFQLPSFEWPDAPPDFAYEFPDASELPTPPQRLVSLADQEYDYSQDSAYQGALSNADFAYERAVKAAEKILISAQQSIYQDWQSQKSTAQAEYRADMAEAARLQDQKRKEGTNPVDLKEVMAKYLADVVAENERFERERVRSEDDYAAELERVASTFASGGLSAAERDTAVHTAVVGRDQRRSQGPVEHALALNELIRIKDDLIASHDRWEADRQADAEEAFGKRSVEAEAKLSIAEAQSIREREQRTAKATADFEQAKSQADFDRSQAQSTAKHSAASEVDSKTQTPWARLQKALADHEKSYRDTVEPKMKEAAWQRILLQATAAISKALATAEKVTKQAGYLADTVEKNLDDWKEFVKAANAAEEVAQKDENAANKKLKDSLDEADKALKEIENPDVIDSNNSNSQSSAEVIQIVRFKWEETPFSYSKFSYTDDGLGGAPQEKADRWAEKQLGPSVAASGGSSTPSVIAGLIGKEYDAAVAAFDKWKAAQKLGITALYQQHKDIAAAQEKYDKAIAVAKNGKLEKPIAENNAQFAIDYNKASIDAEKSNETSDISKGKSLVNVAKGVLETKLGATFAQLNSDISSYAEYYRSLVSGFTAAITNWSNTNQTNYSKKVSEAATGEANYTTKSIYASEKHSKTVTSIDTRVADKAIDGSAALVTDVLNSDQKQLDSNAVSASTFVTKEANARRTFSDNNSDAKKANSTGVSEDLESFERNVASAQDTSFSSSIDAAFDYLKARAGKHRDMLVSQVENMKTYIVAVNTTGSSGPPPYATLDPALEAIVRDYKTSLATLGATADNAVASAASSLTSSVNAKTTTFVSNAATKDFELATSLKADIDSRFSALKDNVDEQAIADINAAGLQSKEKVSSEGNFAIQSTDEDNDASDDIDAAGEEAGGAIDNAGDELAQKLQEAENNYAEREKALHVSRIEAAVIPAGLANLAAYQRRVAARDYLDAELIKAEQKDSLLEANAIRKQAREYIRALNNAERNSINPLGDTRSAANVEASVSASHDLTDLSMTHDASVVSASTTGMRDTFAVSTNTEKKVAAARRKYESDYASAQTAYATSITIADNDHFLATADPEFYTSLHTAEEQDARNIARTAADIVHTAALATAETTRDQQINAAKTTYREAVATAMIEEAQDAGNVRISQANAVGQAGIAYAGGGEAIDDAMLDSQESADNAFQAASNPIHVQSSAARHQQRLDQLNAEHLSRQQQLTQEKDRMIARAGELADAEGDFAKALVDERVDLQQALVVATSPADVRQARTLASLQTESAWFGLTTPTYMTHQMAQESALGDKALSEELAGYHASVAHEDASFVMEVDGEARLHTYQLNMISSNYTQKRANVDSEWGQARSDAATEALFIHSNATSERIASIADATAEGTYYVSESQLGPGSFSTIESLKATRDASLSANKLGLATSTGDAQLAKAVALAHTAKIRADAESAAELAARKRTAAEIRDLAIANAGFQKAYSIAIAAADIVYQSETLAADNAMQLATTTADAAFKSGAMQSQAAVLGNLSQQITLPWVTYQRDLALVRASWQFTQGAPLQIALQQAISATAVAKQNAKTPLYQAYVAAFAESNRLRDVAEANYDYAVEIAKRDANHNQARLQSSVKEQVQILAASADRTRSLALASLQATTNPGSVVQTTGMAAAQLAWQQEVEFLKSASNWNEFYGENQAQRDAMLGDSQASVQKAMRDHDAAVLEIEAERVYTRGLANAELTQSVTLAQVIHQHELDHATSYSAAIIALTDALQQSLVNPWAKYDAAIANSESAYSQGILTAEEALAVALAEAIKSFSLESADLEATHALQLNDSRGDNSNVVALVTQAYAREMASIQVIPAFDLTGLEDGPEGEDAPKPKSFREIWETLKAKWNITPEEFDRQFTAGFLEGLKDGLLDTLNMLASIGKYTFFKGTIPGWMLRGGLILTWGDPIAEEEKVVAQMQQLLKGAISATVGKALDTAKSAGSFYLDPYNGVADIHDKVRNFETKLTLIKNKLESFFKQHGTELTLAILNGDEAKLQEVIQELPVEVRGYVELAYRISLDITGLAADYITPNKLGYLAGQLTYEALEDAALTSAWSSVTAATGGVGGVSLPALVGTKAAHIMIKVAGITKDLPPGIRKAVLEKFQELAWFALKHVEMCFVAGTLVYTAEGLRPIEEIRAGDWVYARPEDNPGMPPRLQKVVQTVITHPNQLFHVTYSNDLGVEEVLSGTGEHPFYVVGQGFIPARQLAAGDRFLLADGLHAEVRSVCQEMAVEGAQFTTYNFEVEYDHTYHVGKLGVWVHNTGFSCQKLAFEILSEGVDLADDQRLRKLIRERVEREYRDGLNDLNEGIREETKRLVDQHEADVYNRVVEGRRGLLDSANPGDLKSPKVVAPNNVPNPYGKLGSPAHRAKVQEVVSDIESRGLQARPEFSVKTVNGQKDVRFMDVVAVDPKTGRVVEVHQVGRTLKSDPMVPIARERAALRDVRYSPELRGAKRFFHDYQQ